MTELPQSLIDAVEAVIKSTVNFEKSLNSSADFIKNLELIERKREAKEHLLAEIRALVKPVEETPELVERVETAVFEAMASPALPPFPMSWQELQQEKGNLAEKSVKVVRDVTKAAIQAMRGK
jgi:hypothetical protein